MKYSSRSATVLIYTIILINVSLLMAVVILNNNSILSSSKITENLSTKLFSNITDNANINLKLHKTLNNNGTGFLDTISCPGTTTIPDSSITMSGATLVSGISSTLSYSGGVVSCIGEFTGPSDTFSIVFNDDFSDIFFASYNGSDRLVDSGSLTRTFGDGTVITINSDGYIGGSDDIDDNFNSDNYRVNSTGSIDYPGGYGDDDADIRKKIYGYVNPNAGFVKVFWSNEKTNNYISSNTNNIDTINTPASTSSGYIYLDADKPFDIKVLELNRGAYSSFNEITVVNQLEYSSPTGLLGYIQTDASISSSTGSAYSFDLPSQDYAIFLNNTGTGVLFYTLAGEALSGSGLYINPIIDDDGEIVRILGNDIIIDEGRYIGKQSEIIIAK